MTRNHIHKIFGVTKGTEEITQKASAEIQKADPIKASVIIEANVIETKKIEVKKEIKPTGE